MSSLLFMVQQCEFEEYRDNVILTNYQGPWNGIESEAECNNHRKEHGRQICRYLLAVQQLTEPEIRVKLS
jgi:hypothetical protein